MAYIKELYVTGLDINDFTRAKRVMYADFIKSFDSTENIAENLFSYVCDGIELMSCANAIDSITFEYVTELLHSEFDEKYVTLSIINPINNSK